MTIDTRGRPQQQGPSQPPPLPGPVTTTTPVIPMTTTSPTTITSASLDGGGVESPSNSQLKTTTPTLTSEGSSTSTFATTITAATTPLKTQNGSDSGVVTSPADLSSASDGGVSGGRAVVGMAAMPNSCGGLAINVEELIASFPVDKMTMLTQKISLTRWVVPVLPEQELECLLNAAIQLTEAGCDHDSEPCMRFYREGLNTSFVNILTDEAVNSWKPNIQNCILMSCGKLIQLCASHMKRDNPFLLELLAVALDPENKFHTFNASRQPEMFITAAAHETTAADRGSGSSSGGGHWGLLHEVFAVPLPEPRSPKGWLVDLINRFGQMRGFDNLLERFNVGVALLKPTPQSSESDILITSSLSSSNDSMRLKSVSGGLGSTTNSSGGSTSTSLLLAEEPNNSSCTNNNVNNKISLPLIHALLRPFGQCYELLTVSTIERYFMPIWEVVLEILDSLSDDELKREAKPEGRSETINGIVRAIRCLASRIPNQEHLIKELEMFRLKIISRLLQVSSFSGKMNALNEINKILNALTCYTMRTHGLPLIPDDELDWLTAERMAAWIKESDVLRTALKDSLHQPQYVEKLEKILRFLIKEKALTLDDLDAVWKAQDGKHDAIVKNIHDLLAKLAWDFNADQLDHLFDCFQASMTTAHKKQRERLLEFIRRLAEDDKNGVMANKVLKLFWNLAHSSEVPPEVLDQALAAHVKILDYSCSQDRDAQKAMWLNKCVEQLKSSENWQLPALRLIREICCLYEASHQPKQSACLNRHHIIETLQNDHTLVVLVTQSLTGYMERVRAICKENPQLDPQTLVLDGRYPHTQQIQERLDFLKFLLKDGQLWLCADQAEPIWHCLAVDATCVGDREECFRWFGKLMGEEPDLDPGINKVFFENNILQLDPQLLTESGIRCFERFFKAVNAKELKLQANHRGYVLDDEDLIGKDYLWRVITNSGEDIASKAIELLKEVSTALGPRLQLHVAEFHEKFIGECYERLWDHYKNIEMLTKICEETVKQQDTLCEDIKAKRLKEAEKMCRVIRVLQEYIKECDRMFTGDRHCLPLGRAHRGKQMFLHVRVQMHNRQAEDVELLTHSNESVMGLKRMLTKRIKNVTNVKVELYYGNGGELVETGDDRSPLSQFAFRDKMILGAKLTQMGSGMASSPDSSSDSSTGSPPRPCPDMQRLDTEACLPGVLIAQKCQYVDFFLKIYQLGTDIQHGSLRDCARLLLQIIPVDRYTVQKLETMCRNRITDIIVAGQQLPNPLNQGMDDSQNLGRVPPGPTLESLFLHAPSAQVLYNLEVLHAILIPAIDPMNDSTLRLQLMWLHSGVAHFGLELLTKNSFLSKADVHTKRAAFHCVLRLAKLFVYIVGCVLSRVGDESVTLPTDGSSGSISQVEILKHVLISMPGSNEQTLRVIATKLAQKLAEEMLSEDREGHICRALFSAALQWSLPDFATIKAIVTMAWAASCGSLHKLSAVIDFYGEASSVRAPDSADFTVCKEALELLSIALVLNPSANEALNKERTRQHFITSLVLINGSRHVRQVAAEQLFLSCTYCAADRRPFSFMVKFLVSALQSVVPQHAATCAEFFQLLCRILNYGGMSGWSLPNNERLLAQEIAWLRSVRQTVKETGETRVHEDLLEGHLCLTKELLLFYLHGDLKANLNALIEELTDDFLFPASRLYLNQRRANALAAGAAGDKTAVGREGSSSESSSTRDDIYACVPPPVCRSPHTIAAASDLLVAMCQNSVPNMTLLVDTLIDMFCSETEPPLKEWEYLPPVGPRPHRGFVGLKNAGATCYMNSVLQQLFMIPQVRCGILAAIGAATDLNEDFSGETDYLDGVAPLGGNGGGPEKNYHVGILKHVQAIFAHLGHSALQFYIPKGLWTHFKLQGQPVNLREQQDAVEFFMSLFESLDEGMKALGHPQLMGQTLGGCFSDQKICQECPHRYSKEEPFSVISVDIRNHSSLTDSLEQYVKGELLEGADAYHCDKCDKKVVTVKRLCVRKLPPVLAIQLKRFEYDYERVCAIKFNDYFEFPRILDMEPYTVSGLAKIEGEVIELEDETTTTGAGGEERSTSTKYQLSGIVVHSGQASGGHYFSYIVRRDPKAAPDSDNKEQWYKFDDGDVTECKMHEDEEMKTQCFGGDYMGEVYDNNSKRVQFRRQKRWWNAYMLFYTQCDQQPPVQKVAMEQLSLAESHDCILTMPLPIERSVRLQNVHFLHSRSMFSPEFFNFIRKLVSCYVPPQRDDKVTAETEELLLLDVKLASQFLFHVGFRTKKNLRGAANDWYDTLCQPIRFSKPARRWFAQNALLSPPGRLCEYILLASSPEVRTAFVKLVGFTCHCAIDDEPVPGYEGSNLAEQILIKVLALLKVEVPENGKHLPHYFSIFYLMCSGTELKDKQLLIKLKVPEIFMRVALDEGPGPPIKYEYPDFSKLHQVVSNLIRCCDLSARCENSTGQAILPNPYAASETLLPMSTEAYDYLLGRTSYIKKMSDDANVGDDDIKLLQFCSWENPQFSHLILTELMWQCGYANWHDLRHHTDLLLQILLVKDSWQSHRIHNALVGVMDDRDGLLDTIQRSKAHFQKRGYIIIKMLVHLFRRVPTAHAMLKSNPRIGKQWTDAVEWLQEELERRDRTGGGVGGGGSVGGGGQYNYNSWSPPAQSNENTNGYTLERSQSAKNVLQKAFDLCPEEEPDEQIQIDSDVEPFEENGNGGVASGQDIIQGVDDHETSGGGGSRTTSKSTPSTTSSSSATISQTNTATTSTSSDSRTIIDDLQTPNLDPVVQGLQQLNITPADDEQLPRIPNVTEETIDENAPTVALSPPSAIIASLSIADNNDRTPTGNIVEPLASAPATISPVVVVPAATEALSTPSSSGGGGVRSSGSSSPLNNNNNNINSGGQQQ